MEVTVAAGWGCALSETWHKCPIIILSRVDRTQCHQFEFDMLSLLLKWDYLFIPLWWSILMLHVILRAMQEVSTL